MRRITMPREILASPHRVLDGKFYWLLSNMCLRKGIDTKYIDPELNYWENKENIEKQFPGTFLTLTGRGEAKRLEEEMGPEEEWQARSREYERERARYIKEQLAAEALLEVRKSAGKYRYGSRARPLSFSWAADLKPGEIVPSASGKTGYFSILVRNSPLSDAAISAYELTPLDEDRSVGLPKP